MEVLDRLKTMGFERDCDGRKYLADCIRIYADSKCRATFTEMYAVIAQKYRKSPDSIMKAMKYAINGAILSNGRDDFLAKLVKDNGNVTVREFVAEFAVRFETETVHFFETI